jgi:hypothetical protein
MPGDDAADFANEFQHAVDGGFNPFSLLTGALQLRAVFLAPLSPSLAEGIARFQAQGDGPLAGLVQQFIAGGLAPAEARARLSEMLAAANGVLVTILGHDQGVQALPQLFFGRIDGPFIEHAVATATQQVPEQAETLRGLMRQLAVRSASAQDFTGLYASSDADADADATAFWSELAADFLTGLDEGILPGGDSAQKDLAFWIAAGLSSLNAQGRELGGEDILAAARCLLLADELTAAGNAIDALLDQFEPEEETLHRLLSELVRSAIVVGRPAEAAALLERHRATIGLLVSSRYEIELLRFRALAAAASEPAVLLAAAQALAKADRKSARHDLNREALWAVPPQVDGGEALDVAQAAAHLDRSINFVAKRLETGTLPSSLRDGVVVIPARALDAWRAVAEALQLLD